MAGRRDCTAHVRGTIGGDARHRIILEYFGRKEILPQRQCGTRGKHHSSLNDISEFPDISRPGVVYQPVHGLR